MKLILEAIKALFRKTENIILSISNALEKKIANLEKKLKGINSDTKVELDNLYSEIGKINSKANAANSNANAALAEAEKGLRFYSIIATAYPVKTSQLNVGEETSLDSSKYDTQFARAIKNYKKGDIILCSYVYYSLNDTIPKGAEIMLTHDGYNLVGGDWQIIDGVPQYYELRISKDASNSKIYRYI